MKNQGLINTLHLHQPKLWVVHIFPQTRDSRVSKMRAHVKITPREKGEIRWRERDLIFLSLHLVSLFLRVVIFTHACVLLAHLLSQRKNGDYSQSNVTMLTWTTFMKISIIVLQLSSIYFLNTLYDQPLIEINSLKLFWPSAVYVWLFNPSIKQQIVSNIFYTCFLFLQQQSVNPGALITNWWVISHYHSLCSRCKKEWGALERLFMPLLCRLSLSSRGQCQKEDIIVSGKSLYWLQYMNNASSLHL